MGFVKAMLLEWQEESATPQQLELPFEKQVVLAQEWHNKSGANRCIHGVHGNDCWVCYPQTKPGSWEEL